MENVEKHVLCFRREKICIHILNFVFSLYSDEEKAHVVSPLLGNVCFASAQYAVCFTLRSFANLYAQNYPGVNVKEFARRMWGDIYFNSKT